MSIVKRSAHCLPLEDKFRVAKYLEAHKERLHAERPGYQNLADVISKELGIVCTEANVRSIAHANGTAWTARTIRGDAAVRSNNTRILARAVCEIADALEIKVDQAVVLIAAGRNPARPGSGLPT